VVVTIALLERRDVGANQPRLVALDARVGVGDVDLAGADRLDLRAGQDETGLDRLLDRELVSRLPVQRDGVLGNLELLGTRDGKRQDRRSPRAKRAVAFVAHGRRGEASRDDRSARAEGPERRSAAGNAVSVVQPRQPLHPVTSRALARASPFR
jgi:hypothetical protein